MPLAEVWKTAKTSFKTKTDKKKPSAKFIGVFNKGTGIEASLKKADTAKNAGDLRTALTQFQKDGTAYVKVLKATIADPSSVPTTTKGDYLSAVTALEGVLSELITTGSSMAEALEGTNKKDKVDPTAIKFEAELNEYLKLRQSMEGILTKVLSEYNQGLVEVNDSVSKAQTHTANAKKEKGLGNLTGANVSIGVVRNFKEKADKIAADINKDWNDRKKQGGPMMTARLDKTSTIPKTSWSKEKQAEFSKESNAAFKAYDAVQIKIQETLAVMGNKMKSLNVLLEEAETYSGQGVDASVYVKRLEEVNKTLTDLTFWVDKKRQATANTHDKQKVILEKIGPTTDPIAKGQVLKQFQTALNGEKQAQPLLAQRQQGLVEMAKRVNMIPVDDRTVPSVAPGYKQFQEGAKKVNTELVTYKGEQIAYIDFLTKAVNTLSA